jgi:hypothetical protein
MLYELLGLIMSILYSTTSDKLKEKSATTGPKPLFHGGPKQKHEVNSGKRRRDHKHKPSPSSSLSRQPSSLIRNQNQTEIFSQEQDSSVVTPSVPNP